MSHKKPYLDFSRISRSINVVAIALTNTKDGFPARFGLRQPSKRFQNEPVAKYFFLESIGAKGEKRVCENLLPSCYTTCMNTHYALINRLTAKPGKRDEVMKILLTAGKPFQDNASCILFLVSEDVKDPNVIWVEDLWTSKEEHAAALARPDFRPFVAQAMSLLEGMPEQIEIHPAGGKGL